MSKLSGFFATSCTTRYEWNIARQWEEKERERERERKLKRKGRKRYFSAFIRLAARITCLALFLLSLSCSSHLISSSRTEETCLSRRLNPWLPGRKHGERKSLPEPIFPYAILKNRSLGPDVLDQSLPCADFEVYFYLSERAFIQADFRLWTLVRSFYRALGV